MQKKCPTLQQIRIDKLNKENRELAEKVSDWKFRYWVLGAIFILDIIIDIIKNGL